MLLGNVVHAAVGRGKAYVALLHVRQLVDPNVGGGCTGNRLRDRAPGNRLGSRCDLTDRGHDALGYVPEVSRLKTWPLTDQFLRGKRARLGRTDLVPSAHEV